MAASSTNTLPLSIVATTVLIQFRAVNALGAVPAAAAASLGIAQQGAAIGEPAPIVVLGTAIGEAGAAVAVGAALETDALGRFITRTAGVPVGRALTAGTLGTQLEIFLIPN